MPPGTLNWQMNRFGTIGLLLLITGMGFLCLHRESSPAGRARIKMERDRASTDVAGEPVTSPKALDEYDPYFIHVNQFCLTLNLPISQIR